MTTGERPLADQLGDLYPAAASDPAFGVVLGRVRADTDTQLADLIEADGRIRLRMNKTVSLDRYLGAVPDLTRRMDPLDAAIDMTLRSLARTGHAEEQAVRNLCDDYPQLSGSIRDAAALHNALWSTQHIQDHVVQATIRELPCDFGPVLVGGDHRYELRELLGEGAFGQVYLAVDRQLSEPDHPALVSIKLLTGDDRSPDSRRRLIDEATKARRINHPNVAQVLDRGVSADNEDFIVHEYVGGGDLAQWAHRHGDRVPIEDAARMMVRVARGVHAAHMAGVVHCDLKPSNVVLSTDGDPKVADFGVAIRSDERHTPHRTQDADVAPVGNLAFMSPEQYRMDDGALTIPTDVYALGGILFWLLTEQLPNGSTAEEIRQTHDAVSGRAEPPHPRAIRPDVDRDLDAVCRRAMGRLPEERFNSAAEVADNLESWLRREPIRWNTPSIVHRLSLWTRRKPAVAGATIIIFLLVAASGVMIFNAAVARAELRAETAERIEFKGNLRSMVARLKKARDEGLDHDVLPQIWLLEWAFSPKVYGEGEHLSDLWEVRIQVVGDLIHEANSRGGERSFQTMLWESALAFWLIGDGRHSEAEPLLTDNYLKWSSILETDDPWLLQLRAMQACVMVGLAVGDPEQAASTLEEAEGLLASDEPGSGLHRLVLTHLQLAYGHDLLDRPQRLLEIDEALRKATE